MMIGDVEVLVHDGVVRWTSGMEVDCDGAPTCYAPLTSGLVGLDYLSNAGGNGRWPGLVCNVNGIPYVQQAGHPAPGYYVTQTALCNSMYGDRDPRRYVDASTVPFIVLPPELHAVGARLGDVALVSYQGKSSAAVCADIGPHGHCGEGSPALHQALGANPFRCMPTHKLTGIDADVSFLVFCGSSQGWPRSWASVAAQVAQLGPRALSVS